MRTAFVCCLLGTLSVLPLISHADDDDIGISAKDIKTLFFGHDDRTLVTHPAQAPWDAIGQLETASGNLCTATLISPHLALPAGHCLIEPPRGKLDKAVALRFVSQKGTWRYEIHDIEGRVDPSLGNVSRRMAMAGLFRLPRRRGILALLCCVTRLQASPRYRYSPGIKMISPPH